MPRRKKAGSIIEEHATTGEIIAAAPRLSGFGEVDIPLLDEAVAEINRIYVGKGLEMYSAVGEYVLTTFFDGDPETFHVRGKGHATFRALAERPDLRLSYSALYNAVAVVDQRRLLPDDLTTTLPFTHQKLLLPVRDETVKVDLARKAVDEDMTTRELAKEVKRVKERQREGSKVGRPNLPAFVKALGRLRRIREQAVSEPITVESFASYSPEKAKLLLADVEHWILGLQETVDQVRGALADTEADRMAASNPPAADET